MGKSIKFFRVSTKDLTGAVQVKDGLIVRAAPILSQFVGSPVEDFIAYYGEENIEEVENG